MLKKVDYVEIEVVDEDGTTRKVYEKVEKDLVKEALKNKWVRIGVGVVVGAAAVAGAVVVGAALAKSDNESKAEDESLMDILNDKLVTDEIKPETTTEKADDNIIVGAF